MVSFFRDMANLRITFDALLHASLILVKSSLLFSFIETRCQKRKIRWELFSTFLRAFVSWEGFFLALTRLLTQQSGNYLLDLLTPCENPKSILLQGSPWTLISRLISTCHGIQLSVYMDLYVENKYSEYYCYGCALVTLQYRSEISEPPNTEFGKFVRIVWFPGPFSRF